MVKKWLLGALFALMLMVGVAFATTYTGYRVFAMHPGPPRTIEVYPAGEAPNPPDNISIWLVDVNCDLEHVNPGDEVVLQDWGDPGDGDIDKVWVVR